ncbi:MAG: VWA domain-containing protein [Gammaproteobacteria bacterium]|nr:VWA domain-containing protein [Gammaproteobacteria bacterium]
MQLRKMYALFSMMMFYFLLGWSATLYAASSPLTKHDTTSGVGFFDLTVTLDWTPDQADKDGRLKTAFEQFAKDTFMMTEGKQKIRKLFVFVDSAQMNSSDIRMLDSGGRSNANPAGLFKNGARILTYTSFSSGTVRSNTYIGHTIAHEFAHYAHALYDEYSGGRSSSSWPTTPLSGDNARPTIMNSQGTYQVFSTITDYDTAPEQKTAQWRYYGSSAWETLVRNPTNDTRPSAYRTSNGRVRYAEFSGVTAPAATALTAPTTGWDSDFEIIYMEGGSIAVLVIDDSGSMGGSRMTAAIGAAKQFIDLMSLGEKVAVVGFDSSARVDFALTELVDESNRTAAKAAIDGLSAGGGTDFTSALATAQTVLAATTSSDNRYLVMMSDGEADAPDTSWYQTNSVPIYTIALGDGADATVLQSMANATNGLYVNSPTNEELANVYAEVRRATGAGSNETLAASSEADLLTGNSNTWVTNIGSSDGSTLFRVAWVAGTVAFQLTDPNGVIITPSNLPDGVTYSNDSNYAIYTIDAPANGDWTAQVTADADGNVTYEVTTQSLLNVALLLTGGNFPEPIGIMATVTGPEAVIGATVIASIEVPVGADAVADMALRDDGVAPDQLADDGVYSGVFAGYSVNGEYMFNVIASNPDGVATFDSAGTLEAGDDAAAVALTSFSRAAVDDLTVADVVEQPTNSANATLLSVDNTTMWGAITVDEGVVWYKFNATQGATYYIQTSGLLTWDLNDMATLLTLYDTDATTELASSSHYDGGDVSYVEWTAPATDTYYVKVAHASPGTGSYGLTVGGSSVYSNSFGVSSNAVGSSGGGGFGIFGCSVSTNADGSVDPTLLLLILVAAFGFMLRRRSNSTDA